ncbi:cupredoxin domain-containing protein [Candidatus Uhrbacteria bacterium]|nr:cupredoxin domain-containing protein [Candidatus Uhrbacteria bacterium]
MKVLSLLAVLALVGAGCTAQNNSQTSAEANTDTQLVVGQDVGQPTQVDADDSQPSAAPADAGIIQEDAQTGTAADGNGVPVTEVILGETPDVKIEMEADNFSFKPNVINASPGDRISITFTKNSGFHTFVIDEANVEFTVVEGQILNFTAPDVPGSYPIYCDIGSHRAFGMEGTLIVK